MLYRDVSMKFVNRLLVFLQPSKFSTRMSGLTTVALGIVDSIRITAALGRARNVQTTAVARVS